MTVQRARCAGAITVAVLVAALSGCGSEGEEGSAMDADQVEQVAQEARGYIDEVAATIGSDPEVKQDTIPDCVPGDSDSGKELIYIVHVSAEPGSKDRVLRQLQDEWGSRGWEAEPGDAMDLRLSKDSYSIAVGISDRTGRAAVVGGGGCVE